MNVYELWRARREGRFGLKHYFWAWVIGSRFFAIPWASMYALFGALVAGFKDPLRGVLSAVVVALVLLAAHYRNNYRDVELGVDKIVEDPNEASKIISVIKPYTAAAWLVPLKITGITMHKVSEYAFLALATAIYLIYFAFDPNLLIRTLPAYALGVLLAETYTDFWKPRRLGEVSAFLGHGFASVVFGYLSQSPNVINALIAGLPAGFISGTAYSVDQYLDVKTDFVRRVRAIYESWFNSRMPLALYVLTITAFYYMVLITYVAINAYPKEVLLTLTLIPYILHRAPALEWEREKAVRDLVVVIVNVLPLLMCLGAALGLIA